MTHLFMLHCTCCMISCHKNAAHVLPPSGMAQWYKNHSEFVPIFKNRPFKILALYNGVVWVWRIETSSTPYSYRHWVESTELSCDTGQ